MAENLGGESVQEGGREVKTVQNGDKKEVTKERKR